MQSLVSLFFRYNDIRRKFFGKLREEGLESHVRQGQCVSVRRVSVSVSVVSRPMKQEIQTNRQDYCTKSPQIGEIVLSFKMNIKVVVLSLTCRIYR